MWRISVGLEGRSSPSRVEGRRKEWVFSCTLDLKPSERNRIFAFSLLEEISACRSLRHCFHQGLSPRHSSKSKSAYETPLDSKMVKGEQSYLCVSARTIMRLQYIPNSRKVLVPLFFSFIDVFKHLFHAKCCAQFWKNSEGQSWLHRRLNP